jgi:hypothetical protein
MTVPEPPSGYGCGVSLYSAAWPLLRRPVSDFQVGLASTWILPDNHNVTTPLVPHGTVARDTMPERGPSFWTVFQTIEGGLGYWTSEKFFSTMPKFRMNGTPDGYNHEISTPGWEFSGKPLPGEFMGIVQLSSHVLVPPDGVTLDPNTCGQLFGYAWMALPLMPARAEPVATGNQCWTAFFNTKNFRGPVAFYLPEAWSRMSKNYPPAVGRGLDALPGVADSGAIEINTVPEFVGSPVEGVTYTRIPQLQFPADANGQTVLMHGLTAYSKRALWDRVSAWKAGSPAPSSAFDPKGAYTPVVKANPLEVSQGEKHAQVEGLDRWVSTANLDPYTFGLQWKPASTSASIAAVRWEGFPDCFRQRSGALEAVSSDAVPAAAKLQDVAFPLADRSKSYLPSESGRGVWQHPGPKAGPFHAMLADKSDVTYYWYRFIDQPSLQHVALSHAERAKLQELVERIQRNWTPEKEYLAPPRRGELASLDSNLIVTPPKGMEVGYVPIAVRQEPGH